MIKAIPFPVETALKIVPTSEATYSSTDSSDTSCPLNHALKYTTDGKGGWNYNTAVIWSDSLIVPIGQASGLVQNFRLSAGLVNIATEVTKQLKETEHKYYVCGLEKPILASSNVYGFVGSVSTSYGTVSKDIYAAWFTLDTSATGATTSCVVNKYELFQSDKSTALSDTVASIDS
jgi:hypothetical protein